MVLEPPTKEFQKCIRRLSVAALDQRSIQVDASPCGVVLVLVPTVRWIPRRLHQPLLMREMLFRLGGQAVQVFPYFRRRRTRRNRILQRIAEPKQGAMFRINQGKINLVPFTPTEMPHFCILASFRTSNTYFPQSTAPAPSLVGWNAVYLPDGTNESGKLIGVVPSGEVLLGGEVPSPPVRFQPPEWREPCPSSTERRGNTKMDYVLGHG